MKCCEFEHRLSWDQDAKLKAVERVLFGDLVGFVVYHEDLVGVWLLSRETSARGCTRTQCGEPVTERGRRRTCRNAFNLLKCPRRGLTAMLNHYYYWQVNRRLRINYIFRHFYTRFVVRKSTLNLKAGSIFFVSALRNIFTKNTRYLRLKTK